MDGVNGEVDAGQGGEFHGEGGGLPGEHQGEAPSSPQKPVTRMREEQTCGHVQHHVNHVISGWIQTSQEVIQPVTNENPFFETNLIRYNRYL